MTACLRWFGYRPQSPTIITVIDDPENEPSSASAAAFVDHPKTTQEVGKGGLDSSALDEAEPDDFDGAYKNEKSYWQRLYEEDVPFRKLIDQYAEARKHVQAAKQSGTLTVAQIDELDERLGASLAIAFGLANDAGWTRETEKSAAAASSFYKKGSIYSNFLTQLPGLVRGGVNFALDLASMYDPDQQCMYQGAKAVVDVLYVGAQAYLAVMVPLWNAGWQPTNVAAQGHEGPPWQPAIVSSKLVGEDGKPAPIITALDVKQQWQLLNRVSELTKDGTTDPKTGAEIKTLTDHLVQHREAALLQALELEGIKSRVDSQDAELVRLRQLSTFLGDMVDCLNAAGTERSAANPAVFKKHRRLLKDHRAMGMLYGQLFNMRATGHARTFRNVANGASTTVSLYQNCSLASGLLSVFSTSSPSPFASPEANVTAMSNGTLPAHVDIPCSPSDRTGFDATSAALGALTFGLNLTQVIGYSWAYGKACTQDYLGKLATQFKILGASGLGNFTGADGEVDPSRLNKAMKGPIALRVGNMKTVLEYERSLATMALLGNKLRAQPESNLQDVLTMFGRCKTAEKRRALVESWGLTGEDRSHALANLKEHEKMQRCLDRIGKGELETMLASADLPDRFKLMFRGSLQYVRNPGDPENARQDGKLSDLVGMAKKYEDLESVLQSAQKYGQQFAAVVAGSGSPQALKALGTLAAMAMAASGLFDARALTKSAAALKAGINTVSLLGSIIGIGLGYGYHKHILLKNAQRARYEGEITYPNSGVLARGRFKNVSNINCERKNGRLSDFTMLSGKTLSSSPVPIKSAGLWEALKEQVWASGLNSKSAFSKWMKFFKAQPGKLTSKKQLDEWLDEIKRAAEDVDSSEEDVSDSSQKPDTRVLVRQDDQDEPAFTSRLTWQSNRFSKPPAKVNSVWPLISAQLVHDGEPDGAAGATFAAAVRKGMEICGISSEDWRDRRDGLTRLGQALGEGVRRGALNPRHPFSLAGFEPDLLSVLMPWIEPLDDLHTQQLSARDVPSALTKLRPGNPWFRRDDGESAPMWYSPEVLSDVEGNAVCGGYVLVPDGAIDHLGTRSGPPAFILSDTPPHSTDLYREHQQGDYCGLHVLNMINKSTHRTHDVLLTAAQAGALLQETPEAELHGFDTKTLIDLNKLRKSADPSPPQLIGLQCTTDKAFTLDGTAEATTDHLKKFTDARIAGITFRHRGQSSTANGHTVLLLKDRHDRFWAVDPRNPAPLKIDGDDMDMQQAARAYFRDHGADDGGADAGQFDVFFPKKSSKDLWHPRFDSEELSKREVSTPSHSNSSFEGGDSIGTSDSED